MKNKFQICPPPLPSPSGHPRRGHYGKGREVWYLREVLPALSSVSPLAARPGLRWPNSLRACHPLRCQHAQPPAVIRPSPRRPTLMKYAIIARSHLVMLKVINIFRGRWLTLNWIMPPRLMGPWLGLNLWPLSALSNAFARNNNFSFSPEWPADCAHNGARDLYVNLCLFVSYLSFHKLSLIINPSLF